MPSVVTIGGSTINLDTVDAILIRATPWVKDGTPSLTIQRRGIALPGLPDPWLGKELTWTLNSTLYFVGDIITVDPPYEDQLGWVFTYTALGLRYKGDLIPVNDENTGTDMIQFNLPGDDSNFNPARAGRTIGQILQTVLEMETNANRLDDLGIGNFTGLPSTPALPTATQDDLDLLTMVPPYPVSINGEKLLNGLQGFLQSTAPNHTLHIEPDGTIRFIDLRTFTPQTLTMGIDPVIPPTLKRSVQTCFGRVVVRGQPLTEPVIVSTLGGTLEEFFDHDSLDNAAAIAAWTLYDFIGTETAADEGSCSCTSTITVEVDPTDATHFWSANFWDQTTTGAHGVIYLTYSVGTGIDQLTSRRIIANDALTAGGTAELTLDLPLPITDYDSYQIYGHQSGASIVWRRYRIVNPDIADRMANHFNYPVPFRNSDGSSATLTSFPTSDIVFGTGPVYFHAPWGFVQDSAAGTITFLKPVVSLSETDQGALLAGSGYDVPVDVRVLLAINKSALTSTQPPDVATVPQYEGTSYTVEGLERTLYVMVSSWRDQANQSAMDEYTREVLDSVKDTVVEGALDYLGLFEDALTPGVSISIEGNNGAPVVTGWEDLELPIVEVELLFPQGNGVIYQTRMTLSNRRAQYTGEMYSRPARAGGMTLGGEDIPWQLAGMSSAGGYIEAGSEQYKSMLAGAGYNPPTANAGTMNPVGAPNLASVTPNLAPFAPPKTGAPDLSAFASTQVDTSTPKFNIPGVP